MKKVLFVDLDDTLFQSQPKCPASAELKPIAYLKDGNPISYATPAQISMLQMFQKEMLVIPVTARNLDAFSRVKIDFKNGAVLNYGGVILEPDGTVDKNWLDKSLENSSRGVAGLEFFQLYIEYESKQCKFDLKSRIISDLELPFYVVAKSPSYDTDSILKIAQLCEQKCNEVEFSEYRVHVNGNNLAILPSWLDKRHAVQYLLEKLSKTEEQFVTFGMGDSLIDLGFMSECQYMIVPTVSQIAGSRMVKL
ncbi:MAG: HAD hydrolase family protein [Deltaproteobacteria bacterium]